MAQFWIKYEGRKYFDELFYMETLYQNTGYEYPSLWKLVPGCQGRYICSNLGKLIGIKPKIQILKPDYGRFKENNQRVRIMLMDDQGIRKLCVLHRIVVLTWKPIDNPKELEVNHIDGNKFNNIVCNLEWVTKQQNIDHANSVGLVPRGLKRHAVKQLDMQGNLIAEHESITTACVAIEQDPLAKTTQLSAVCLGKRYSAYGYRWEYATNLIDHDGDNWRVIDGYSGYKVSRSGQIVNTRANKLLKPKIQNGYHYIKLNGSNSKNLILHRLVAKAWIPNPENKPNVDHIDSNPLNNHADNLKWVTQKENMANVHTRAKTSKKIQQMDADGKVIAEYPSIHEVVRQTGYTRSCISDSVNGKRTFSYGYQWKSVA